MDTKLVIAGTDLMCGVVDETANEFRVFSLDRTEIEVRIELNGVLSIEGLDQTIQADPNPFDLLPIDSKYASRMCNMLLGCVIYDNVKVYVGIFSLGNEILVRVTTSIMIDQKLLNCAADIEEVCQNLLNQQVVQLDKIVEKLKLKLELSGTYLVNANIEVLKM